MKTNAVIFDLDGTLCNCSHRRHFVESNPKDWDAFYESISQDEVNENVAYVSALYQRIHHKILFVTGRPERYRKETCDWLERMMDLDTYDYKLFMRPDGDHQPDHELKKKIYQEIIEPRYNVSLVLDDRDSVVKMWRSLGLECWQVAQGDF